MHQESHVLYTDLISPLGFSMEENFKALCQGASGLKPNTHPLFKRKTYTSVIDATLVDDSFSVLGAVDQYTKLEKLSILLIDKMLKETNIDPRNPKTLLIYSTTKGNIDLAETKNDKIPSKRVLLSEFKNVLKAFFEFANDPILISNACISGSQAIIYADSLLKTKLYDHVIIVGGDVVSNFTLSGFYALNALSEELCKPFDVNRKGINIGECCTTIVLTSKKESNTAKLVAGSSTVDAHHIVAPSREGRGLTNAIQNCIQQYPDAAIDFISTHGTATKYNDEMEALSINNTNLEKTPIYSLKGYYGHTLGAAGILESVISLNALKEQLLIPSLGYTTLGVPYEANVITTLEKKPISGFLKTASGFGGVNAALIFQQA
ncbi:3-oxoacyl-[acyl-carrier-protein] synthase 2 [Kordia antarctica]|uniref:3-oxoacyl-[acyl-carrier-protein] synthase 2 n=1 Tax=Kordia antarctica TaxID=1218801 RepID=A0A7L4ZK96_9FLAO|nr:beta-ketoacyl synthase N-terminal-like domain-containing protein [Kordia antarctica]QHI36887.1 3-oxoacyl-[acyl-carrier-protein] synthase 2 [Kordia antarctica]